MRGILICEYSLNTLFSAHVLCVLTVLFCPSSQTGDINFETELQSPLFTLTPGTCTVIVYIHSIVGVF